MVRPFVLLVALVFLLLPIAILDVRVRLPESTVKVLGFDLILGLPLRAEMAMSIIVVTILPSTVILRAWMLELLVDVTLLRMSVRVLI